MFTAIILNWRRPENVNGHIIPALLRHPSLNEVLIVNNSQQAFPSAKDSRILCIEGRDFGLDARFVASLLSKTENILIQDDDLVLPTATIDGLFDSLETFPDVLHGCFGRRPRADNTYARNIDRQQAEVEIVLTRAMVTKRANIACFFDARENKCIKSARNRFGEFGCHPDNGEDIVYSYAVLARNKRLNRIHPLPVKELSEAGVGLSKNLSVFREHRTHIMRSAQTLVAC